MARGWVNSLAKGYRRIIKSAIARIIAATLTVTSILEFLKVNIVFSDKDPKPTQEFKKPEV
ncbi:MAG: hypothetical protein ACJAZJ_000591 [Candidatus Endobugula sp.]